MQFGFELGTCRQAARCYVFAAESEDDRQQWMTTLAKVPSLHVLNVKGCL